MRCDANDTDVIYCGTCHRELLEQIKDFEEKEFSGVASRETEFKPRLEPLNESGGSALLKNVRGFLS